MDRDTLDDFCDTSYDPPITPPSANPGYGDKRILVAHFKFPEIVSPPFDLADTTRRLAGAQPFSLTQFFEEISYGASRQAYDIHPWADLPHSRAYYQAADALGNVLVQDARSYVEANYNLAGIDTIALLVMPLDYGYPGCWAGGNTAVLTFPSDPDLFGCANFGGTIAHEIGHTYGFNHTSWLACKTWPFGIPLTLTDAFYSPTDCGVVSGYLDAAFLAYAPYDVMGGYRGHPNAYQKSLAGWLRPSQVIEAPRGGAFVLDSFEVAASGAKAVHVPCGTDQEGQPVGWWVEYRIKPELEWELPSVNRLTDRLMIWLNAPNVWWPDGDRPTWSSSFMFDAFYSGTPLQPNGMQLPVGGVFTDPYRGLRITRGSDSIVDGIRRTGLSIEVSDLMFEPNLGLTLNVNQTRTVTVRNAGARSITFGQTTLRGRHPSSFQVTEDSCSGRVLAQETTCGVSVSHPTSSGRREDAYIQWTTDDPLRPSPTIGLVHTAPTCVPTTIPPGGQPQTITISNGQSTNLAVAPAGTAPLSYQWYEGVSGDIARPVGTSSGSFSTGPLTKTTGYWVRVTNVCGSADSQTAVVIVPCQVPAGLDTDCDGILDTREEQGDMATMGASKNHKDVFIEADYMEDPGDCPFVGTCFGRHSHRLLDDGVATVVQAFAAAPVMNPDGDIGISLHVDNGPYSLMNPRTGDLWLTRSQSNSLIHQDVIDAATDFWAIKQAHFSPSRDGDFHYCLSIHADTSAPRSSGGAFSAPGRNFFVSLGTFDHEVGTAQEQAGSFMHELGHDLGLLHGGADNDERKPNYLSVMNYLFQLRGLRFQGSDGKLDYARFVAAELNEGVQGGALDERQGVRSATFTDGSYGTRYYCPGQSPRVDRDQVVARAVGPVDWNCDGDDGIDGAIQVSIDGNADPGLLRSYEDWGRIDLGGSGATRPGRSLAWIREDLTAEEAALQSADYRVSVSGAGTVTARSNVGAIPVVFQIRNTGDLGDTYTLTSSSSLGWANTSTLPAALTLAAGGTASLTLQILVPPGAATGSREVVTLRATSQGNPSFFDVAPFEVRIVDPASLPHYGDLDSSGSVDIFDVVTLASYLVGNVTQGRAPFSGPTLVADVKADGQINLFDLVVLMGYIVGNVTALPVP